MGPRGPARRAAAWGAGVAAVIAAGCASTATPPVAPRPELLFEQPALELAAAYETHRVDWLEARSFQPEDYWQRVLVQIGGQPERFRVSSIGSSVEGRPLRRIDFGNGRTTVLLWSQMHGNESTATRSLADVFEYLIRNPGDPRVQRIESVLAVTFVPILNPDGAARFVRHNAVGIDINRDARLRATPEAQALKGVRDAVDAKWGFNLHDQNVRTRLGRSDSDVQIALLAPPPGAGETSPANRNAKQLAALIVGTLRPIVGDQIARYDETFNPRAFGDLITQWGTATVLIESGGSLVDPGKELPRQANFVAILAALDAIATESWRQVASGAYVDLPRNGRSLADLVIRGASIVLPGRPPVRADIAIRYDDSLEPLRAMVQEVGDLPDLEALDVIDAAGLYIVPAIELLSPQLSPHLRPGDPLEGVISRDAEGDEVVWILDGGRPLRFVPRRRR